MAYLSIGGLPLAANATLTVRLYFRTGSDTEGRCFVLRDVALKSLQTPLATHSGRETTWPRTPTPCRTS